MPASQIRRLVGHEIWSQYFKFTVVRNPFDKVVSLFSMNEFRKRNPDWAADAESNVHILEGTRLSPDEEVSHFQKWLREVDLTSDRKLYLIDGEECVNFYIRYENLMDDIKSVCAELNLRYEPELLPKYKSGFRTTGISLFDYYDSEAIKIVNEAFAWELNRFGYEAPELEA